MLQPTDTYGIPTKMTNIASCDWKWNSDISVIRRSNMTRDHQAHHQ